MSDSLKQNGWTVAAVVAAVSLLVNLYVLPLRGMEREALMSVVSKLEKVQMAVDKHEVSIAKAESWINLGPRFTKTDADLLKADTLEQARRAAADMDAELRRQISSLGESQLRFEKDLRDFRERSFEVNAELKASVNQVVAQLNTTATTFAGLNGKVTDMLVRLDTMDERKDKP